MFNARCKNLNNYHYSVSNMTRVAHTVDANRKWEFCKTRTVGQAESGQTIWPDIITLLQYIDNLVQQLPLAFLPN